MGLVEVFRLGTRQQEISKMVWSINANVELYPHWYFATIANFYFQLKARNRINWQWSNVKTAHISSDTKYVKLAIFWYTSSDGTQASFSYASMVIVRNQMSSTHIKRQIRTINFTWTGWLNLICTTAKH